MQTTTQMHRWQNYQEYQHYLNSILQLLLLEQERYKQEALVKQRAEEERHRQEALAKQRAEEQHKRELQTIIDWAKEKTMSKSSLADQLGWCITTKDALRDFNHSCVSAANSVDVVLRILRSSSFVECSWTLEVEYPSFQDARCQLFQQINDVDAPYIQKEIEKLREVLGGY